MACPTCNGTMQNLGAESDRIFYCSRCGSLKTFSGSGKGDAFEYVTTPSLAQRVRNAAPDAEEVPLDGKTARHALPEWHWVAICEAAGVKAGT